MVAEPTATTYSDVSLRDYIERKSLMDSDGNDPSEIDWTPTYDLNAAAAEIWQEKAAMIAAHYDVSVDGSTFHRSQALENAQKMARYYAARRSVSMIELQAEPHESTDPLSDDEV
jgi:hypothetical protein